MWSTEDYVFLEGKIPRTPTSYAFDVAVTQLKKANVGLTGLSVTFCTSELMLYPFESYLLIPRLEAGHMTMGVTSAFIKSAFDARCAALQQFNRLVICRAFSQILLMLFHC